MCFIRINPSTAPLNPPGAAPTLTTIYDEVAPPVHTISSSTTATTTTSPSSNPLSKEPSPPTENSKSRRKRSKPFAAKAAKAGVVGTEKEKRRTQTIADSLDLGGGDDLQVNGDEGG